MDLENNNLDMKQLFFNNLILLGFDVQEMEATHSIPFNKAMFELPNKRAAEIVLHFLFQRLNPTMCREAFRDSWPIHDKKREQTFRKTCCNWLSNILQEEPDSHLPRINASMFMSPGGEKFYQLLFYFSGYVMQKVMEIELGVKSSERQKCPVVTPQNVNMQDSILKSLKCSGIRHRKQYFETVNMNVQASEMWKQCVDEYVREYRKLHKDLRELDYKIRDEEHRAHKAAEARGSPTKKRSSTDHFDPEFDPRTIKRSQRIQQVRDMWKTFEDFDRSKEAEQDVVASIVDGKVNKHRIDGSSINVKVPDMVLRECHDEIVKRNVGNTYQGGKLSLEALLQLWNLSLHLVLEKLKQVGVPQFEEEVQKLTPQVHVQQNFTQLSQTLREQMSQKIPEMKASVHDLRNWMDNKFFQDVSPESIRSTVSEGRATPKSQCSTNSKQNMYTTVCRTGQYVDKDTSSNKIKQGAKQKGCKVFDDARGKRGSDLKLKTHHFIDNTEQNPRLTKEMQNKTKIRNLDFVGNGLDQNSFPDNKNRSKEALDCFGSDRNDWKGLIKNGPSKKSGNDFTRELDSSQGPYTESGDIVPQKSLDCYVHYDTEYGRSIAKEELNGNGRDKDSCLSQQDPVLNCSIKRDGIYLPEKALGHTLNDKESKNSSAKNDQICNDQEIANSLARNSVCQTYEEANASGSVGSGYCFECGSKCICGKTAVANVVPDFHIESYHAEVVSGLSKFVHSNGAQYGVLSDKSSQLNSYLEKHYMVTPLKIKELEDALRADNLHPDCLIVEARSLCSPDQSIDTNSSGYHSIRAFEDKTFSAYSHSSISKDIVKSSHASGMVQRSGSNSHTGKLSKNLSHKKQVTLTSASGRDNDSSRNSLGHVPTGDPCEKTLVESREMFVDTKCEVSGCKDHKRNQTKTGFELTILKPQVNCSPVKDMSANESTFTYSKQDLLLDLEEYKLFSTGTKYTEIVDPSEDGIITLVSSSLGTEVVPSPGVGISMRNSFDQVTAPCAPVKNTSNTVAHKENYCSQPVLPFVSKTIRRSYDGSETFYGSPKGASKKVRFCISHAQ